MRQVRCAHCRRNKPKRSTVPSRRSLPQARGQRFVLNLCGRRSDCTLAVQGAAEEAPPTSMTSLILTRASVSRPSGHWREDDYDVLENGVVVGRIFFVDAIGPHGRPWMWASGHNGEI